MVSNNKQKHTLSSALILIMNGYVGHRRVFIEFFTPASSQSESRTRLILNRRKLTPRFSGSGLCPCGRGGVRSLKQKNNWLRRSSRERQPTHTHHDVPFFFLMSIIQNTSATVIEDMNKL